MGSNAMIIGIISFLYLSDFALFDLDSTFSSIFAYISSIIDVICDPLAMSIHVSILIIDSLVVEWVYRSCVMDFLGPNT